MRFAVMILALILAGSMNGLVRADDGNVQISVVDQSNDLLPCRIHLYDKDGKPQRADDLPFFRDHFVCPGKVRLQLPAGDYRVEIERGPEYEQYANSLTLPKFTLKELSICLERIADLTAKGWYSGDLHVHRAIEDIPLLMQAEDLHVAPVITWWNDRNMWSERQMPKNPLFKIDGDRYYHVMAGEDEREGGALMYFNRSQYLPIAGSTREYPSPMKFINQAHEEGEVWIDIEKPFWWDVPIWLASKKIDSVGLAHNHMCRSRMYENEAWGRPRNTDRLPAPRGNGFWTQEIYYHILNCGLRIPPSAGSASGVLPNPLGYNRVYVYCGDEFNYDTWWQGLKAGRSFVTNGPLLMAKANGQLPGYVFASTGEQPVEIELEASLISRDKVTTIEIIRNGKIECTVPTTSKSQSIDLGKMTFHRSGWFLVRAITDLEHTFRFATTAPYYVEVGASKRLVSRNSAHFFLDWVTERIARVPLKLNDRERLKDVLAHHQEAKEFWQRVAAEANAD
jgi:hypothetical protein